MLLLLFFCHLQNSVEYVALTTIFDKFILYGIKCNFNETQENAFVWKIIRNESWRDLQYKVFKLSVVYFAFKNK